MLILEDKMPFLDLIDWSKISDLGQKPRLIWSSAFFPFQLLIFQHFLHFLARSKTIFNLFSSIFGHSSPDTAAKTCEIQS